MVSAVITHSRRGKPRSTHSVLMIACQASSAVLGVINIKLQFGIQDMDRGRERESVLLCGARQASLRSRVVGSL